MKFLNGESSGEPVVLAGVVDAALDLVFIDFCSESLDCFAGDCFRVEVLAVLALVAFGAAFFVVGAFFLAADGLLAASAEALAAVVALAFALGRAGALRLALALAVALLAALVLGAVLLLGRALALAVVLFLAAALAVDLALPAVLAAGRCFFTELADALEAPFAAALVLALDGVFAPFFAAFFAAMFCLWFLTFWSWPRTSDAGKWKGA